MAGTTLGLGACADDGYGRGYSSVSFGMSTGPDFYDRGYYGRGFRDRDGDGVPNRWDRQPYNPYRD